MYFVLLNIFQYLLTCRRGKKDSYELDLQKHINPDYTTHHITHNGCGKLIGWVHVECVVSVWEGFVVVLVQIGKILAMMFQRGI